MSTRNTAPEPENTTDTNTVRPGPLKRATSAVAWYGPELIGIAVTAGAAATAWAPLGVVSAALGAWIAADQVNIARQNRRVLGEIEDERHERAQLDLTTPDEPGEASDDNNGDEASTVGPAREEPAAKRPGWEVAG